MAAIEVFRPVHLEQLLWLVNEHLYIAVPGWSLTGPYLAGALEREPGESIVDPWVVERLTLVAQRRQAVVAGAHLLRYGTGPEVSESCTGAAEIKWVVARAGATDALAALLQEGLRRMAEWGSAHAWAGVDLPVPAMGGVSDAWPHLAEALRSAGFRPEAQRSESVWGGFLDGVPSPAEPPVDGLTVERTLGHGFAAVLGGEVLGVCQWGLDLTDGGLRPAMAGWAELNELSVADGWRSRGIGTWLVAHSIPWLRLAGCHRAVFAVGAEEEANGAGRFYRRLGWEPFTRLQRAWAVPDWSPRPPGDTPYPLSMPKRDRSTPMQRFST